MEPDFDLYLGQSTEGRYILASTVAPYFCFEADSEQAVIDLARRAIQFYEQNVNTPRPSRSTTNTVTNFVPSRVISSRALVA